MPFLDWGGKSVLGPSIVMTIDMDNTGNIPGVFQDSGTPTVPPRTYPDISRAPMGYGSSGATMPGHHVYPA